MPSSSDAVATHTFASPLFSRSSAACRVSRDMLPWCATTASAPSRSSSWCATRSTSRRVFMNTSVVVCSCTSSATRSSVLAHCSCVAMGPSSSGGISSPMSIARACPVSMTMQSGASSSPSRSP